MMHTKADDEDGGGSDDDGAAEDASGSGGEEEEEEGEEEKEEDAQMEEDEPVAAAEGEQEQAGRETRTSARKNAPRLAKGDSEQCLVSPQRSGSSLSGKSPVKAQKESSSPKKSPGSPLKCSRAGDKGVEVAEMGWDGRAVPGWPVTPNAWLRCVEKALRVELSPHDISGLYSYIVPVWEN